MQESFEKSRIVRGGSAKIEKAIREDGWDPLNPVITVAFYVNEATGKIHNSKVVLADTLEGFKVDAKHFFPEAPEGAQMTFGNINLSSLRFSSSQISTKWMPYTEFSWNSMVEENNEQEKITISPTNFETYKVNPICMRVLFEYPTFSCQTNWKDKVLPFSLLDQAS